MPSRRELLFGAFSRPKPAPEQAIASLGVTALGPQIIAFAEHCLAFQNVVCRSCSDACEPGAIRFQPKLGGAAQPNLIAECCTGCGDCIKVCPVAALSLTAALSTEKNHKEVVA